MNNIANLLIKELNLCSLEYNYIAVSTLHYYIFFVLVTVQARLTNYKQSVKLIIYPILNKLSSKLGDVASFSSRHRALELLLPLPAVLLRGCQWGCEFGL